MNEPEGDSPGKGRERTDQDIILRRKTDYLNKIT